MEKTINYFDLKGINAFVTGASGHIGSKISLGLALHGANVFLNGRNRKDILKLHKYFKNNKLKSIPAIFDIRDEKKVKNFFSKNKTIGIIVNNAYEGETGNFDNYSKTKYKNAFNSGILALTNIVSEAKKTLINSSKKHGHASIINISSIYGSISPDPDIYKNTKLSNPPYYGVVKAGVEQFTRYAAVNLAKYNINVNSISPGAFPNEKIKNKNKKFIAKLKKKIPMRRIGTPKDIITSILFLASKDSAYVTGVNIKIDGGWSIW
tara:strand:+ start:550 stop:1344 length:795 start_codon:yes stop_codon:yes gene_type:complete